MDIRKVIEGLKNEVATIMGNPPTEESNLHKTVLMEQITIYKRYLKDMGEEYDEEENSWSGSISPFSG